MISFPQKYPSLSNDEFNGLPENIFDSACKAFKEGWQNFKESYEAANGKKNPFYQKKFAQAIDRWKLIFDPDFLLTEFGQNRWHSSPNELKKARTDVRNIPKELFDLIKKNQTVNDKDDGLFADFYSFIRIKFLLHPAFDKFLLIPILTDEYNINLDEHSKRIENSQYISNLKKYRINAVKLSVEKLFFYRSYSLLQLEKINIVFSQLDAIRTSRDNPSQKDEGAWAKKMVEQCYYLLALNKKLKEFIEKKQKACDVCLKLQIFPPSSNDKIPVSDSEKLLNVALKELSQFFNSLQKNLDNISMCTWSKLIDALRKSNTKIEYTCRSKEDTAKNIIYHLKGMDFDLNKFKKPNKIEYEKIEKEIATQEKTILTISDTFKKISPLKNAFEKHQWYDYEKCQELIELIFILAIAHDEMGLWDDKWKFDDITESIRDFLICMKNPIDSKGANFLFLISLQLPQTKWSQDFANKLESAIDSPDISKLYPNDLLARLKLLLYCRENKLPITLDPKKPNKLITEDFITLIKDCCPKIESKSEKDTKFLDVKELFKIITSFAKPALAEFYIRYDCLEKLKGCLQIEDWKTLVRSLIESDKEAAKKIFSDPAKINDFLKFFKPEELDDIVKLITPGYITSYDHLRIFVSSVEAKRRLSILKTIVESDPGCLKKTLSNDAKTPFFYLISDFLSFFKQTEKEEIIKNLLKDRFIDGSNYCTGGLKLGALLEHLPPTQWDVLIVDLGKECNLFWTYFALKNPITRGKLFDFLSEKLGKELFGRKIQEELSFGQLCDFLPAKKLQEIIALTNTEHLEASLTDLNQLQKYLSLLDVSFWPLLIKKLSVDRLKSFLQNPKQQLQFWTTMTNLSNVSKDCFGNLKKTLTVEVISDREEFIKYLLILPKKDWDFLFFNFYKSCLKFVYKPQLLYLFTVIHCDNWENLIRKLGSVKIKGIFSQKSQIYCGLCEIPQTNYLAIIINALKLLVKKAEIINKNNSEIPNLIFKLLPNFIHEISLSCNLQMEKIFNSFPPKQRFVVLNILLKNIDFNAHKKEFNPSFILDFTLAERRNIIGTDVGKILIENIGDQDLGRIINSLPKDCWSSVLDILKNKLASTLLSSFSTLETCLKEIEDPNSRFDFIEILNGKYYFFTQFAGELKDKYDFSYFCKLLHLLNYKKCSYLISYLKDENIAGTFFKNETVINKFWQELCDNNHSMYDDFKKMIVRMAASNALDKLTDKKQILSLFYFLRPCDRLDTIKSILKNDANFFIKLFRDNSSHINFRGWPALLSLKEFSAMIASIVCPNLEKLSTLATNKKLKNSAKELQSTVLEIAYSDDEQKNFVNAQIQPALFVLDHAIKKLQDEKEFSEAIKIILLTISKLIELKKQFNDNQSLDLILCNFKELTNSYLEEANDKFNIRFTQLEKVSKLCGNIYECETKFSKVHAIKLFFEDYLKSATVYIKNLDLEPITNVTTFMLQIYRESVNTCYKDDHKFFVFLSNFYSEKLFPYINPESDEFIQMFLEFLLNVNNTEHLNQFAKKTFNTQKKQKKILVKIFEFAQKSEKEKNCQLRLAALKNLACLEDVLCADDTLNKDSFTTTVEKPVHKLLKKNIELLKNQDTTSIPLDFLRINFGSEFSEEWCIKKANKLGKLYERLDLQSDKVAFLKNNGIAGGITLGAFLNHLPTYKWDDHIADLCSNDLYHTFYYLDGYKLKEELFDFLLEKFGEKFFYDGSQIRIKFVDLQAFLPNKAHHKLIKLADPLYVLNGLTRLDQLQRILSYLPLDRWPFLIKEVDYKWLVELPGQFKSAKLWSQGKIPWLSWNMLHDYHLHIDKTEVEKYLLIFPKEQWPLLFHNLKIGNLIIENEKVLYNLFRAFPEVLSTYTEEYFNQLMHDFSSNGDEEKCNSMIGQIEGLITASCKNKDQKDLINIEYHLKKFYFNGVGTKIEKKQKKLLDSKIIAPHLPNAVIEECNKNKARETLKIWSNYENFIKRLKHQPLIFLLVSFGAALATLLVMITSSIVFAFLGVKLALICLIATAGIGFTLFLCGVSIAGYLAVLKNNRKVTNNLAKHPEPDLKKQQPAIYDELMRRYSPKKTRTASSTAGMIGDISYEIKKDVTLKKINKNFSKFITRASFAFFHLKHCKVGLDGETEKEMENNIISLYDFFNKNKQKLTRHNKSKLKKFEVLKEICKNDQSTCVTSTPLI